MLQHLFQQAMQNASGIATGLLGQFPVVDLEQSLQVPLQANGVKFAFQSLQPTAAHEVSQHFFHVVDPLLDRPAALLL